MSSESTCAAPPNSMDRTQLKEGEKSAITLLELARQYARENPEIVAAFCFSIGFVIGWKLKPW